MEGQGDGGRWDGGAVGGGMEGRRDGEAVVVIDHVSPRNSPIDMEDIETDCKILG